MRNRYFALVVFWCGTGTAALTSSLGATGRRSSSRLWVPRDHGTTNSIYPLSRTTTRQRGPPASSSTTTTALAVVTGHVAEWSKAAMSLALATTTGRIVGDSDASILVTLVAAAALSNAGYAPISSPLYDACWRYFLPGSLVLLLLSLQSSSPSRGEHDADHVTQTSFSTNTMTKTTSSMQSFRLVAIGQMALPFGLASLASLIGCLVSLALSSMQWRFLPSLTQAKVALSCLLASFIGGSVNFMATSRLVAASSANAGDSSLSTLLSAMAAADLLVMAVYFSVLGAAVTSPALRQWAMGNRHVISNEMSKKTPNTNVTADNITNTLSTNRSQLSWGRRLQGSLMALSVTWVLVEFAHLCENGLARMVPGTACGVLAIVTPLVQRHVPAQAVAVAPFWSEISFLTLFASIGLTAHLGSALRSGPGCLVLSMVVLMVHVAVLLLGTAVWNRLAPRRRIIDLDMALIASNAVSICAISSKIHKKPLTDSLPLWLLSGHWWSSNSG